MSPTSAPTFLDAGDPDRIADRISTEFRDRHGRAPAVVTCAPGRVNLIGEHLDYNGGRCLPAALPHATYAAVAPRPDRVLSVTSLQTAETREVPLDGLAAGAVNGWPAYVAGVLWALERRGWVVPGVDVIVDSRVPIGSGLSSSAALECAVGLAMLPLVDRPDTEEVRRTLVEACVVAEVEMAGAPTGGMDQSVALLATAAHALLLDFADGSARQVPWEPESQGLSLLVVDTRVAHALVEGDYGSRREECERAAAELGVGTLREVAGRPGKHAGVPEELADPVLRRRTRHVLSELDRVDRAVAALQEGDYRALGALFDASHDSLRDDFEVSSPELDAVVEVCREGGALGARMTGGGFGGSAIALLPEGAVPEVSAAVAERFASRGWAPPACLLAPAGPGARQLR